VRLRTRVEQSDQRAAALHQEVQSRQFLNDIPRQYQLSNEQVAEGLDFARRIKQGDLLGVAKDLVAKAAAGGVNISEIVGTTVGDSVDMRAIRAMMDERLGPITRAEAQTVEQDQARERATTAYNEFISINEYADVQGEIIAAYAKNNGVPLQKAYNDVRNFAATNQLDFSLPLGPQIEERRAQAAVPVEQQQQQQQPANNTQLRPMPNGVSTHSSAVTPQTPVYADPDDDWGSIIRRAQSADRPN
jgi:post-segregation antitoxin (ccd killing protein)